MGAATGLEVRALRESQDLDAMDALPLHRLHQGDGRYLVAWLDGEPVGHLHLADGAPPEVQDLFVVEAWRGRGIATALLDAAESAALAAGHAELRMEVSLDNAAARALYERLGYLDAGLAPRRVRGTVQLRTGPLEVDDTLLTLAKPLPVA